MFQMNHDFFDSFPVQFYAKETIVGGEHYPLGHFAVEALAVSGRVFREIDRLQELFQEEFQIFLSARSPQCNSNHIPKIDNEKIPLDVR